MPLDRRRAKYFFTAAPAHDYFQRASSPCRRQLFARIIEVMNARSVVDQLLAADEPSIRWKIRTRVLGEDPDSKSIHALREEIAMSPRVRTLLAHCDSSGRLVSGRDIYDKWQGAHWVLATLADLGYPSGDLSLSAMRDQVLDHWLADFFFREFEVRKRADAYQLDGVPVMQGRHRRCGSQQGNTLLALTRLGLIDQRASRLVERLLHWQWPDGGWNCDKDPSADTSSFMETLLPMCGLAAYARTSRSVRARDAARRAAEVFLTRRLFKRRSDGRIIHPEFTCLHYPLYWHYDILGGLKGMAEVGCIDDPRCADALDLLESKRLPDGGWPAEKRYYKTSAKLTHGADYLDWGGTSTRRMNPWITADALAVLKASGRLAL